MPLTYRGGSGIGTSTQTSLALPTGTQVGDYVVIGGVGNNTVNDARFPETYNAASSAPGADGILRVWTGYATTLANIALTGGTHSHQGVACATFAPFDLEGVVTNLGNDNTIEVPSAAGSAAICVIGAASNVTAAGVPLPPEYSEGVSNGLATSQVRIDYWNTAGAGSSPAVTTTGSVNISNWAVWVLGALAVSAAPPCRLYPRSDHLGIGSGRIFPPPGTRQAGRLNGPY